jgi:hypothetical protein
MKSFSFDDVVAEEFGVEEAVVIRSFQFWIELNRANGRNLKEGRTWTYNTYESLAEQFPFWVKINNKTGLKEPDTGKVRRIIDSLINQSVLIKTSKFNKWKIDKTNWYAFEDEERWLKAKSVEICPLPKNADTENLFENEENSPLLISADGKVSSSILDENATVEKSSQPITTAEKDSPELCNNANVSLLNSADQYQLLNNSKTDEEKNEFASPHELLLDKKPLEAFLNGAADKLAFDFNDLDLLNSKIEQLFRLFVKDQPPNQIFVDRIRNQILNDTRIELSRKVCWMIIQIAFMEYPGVEKKYQNFESLMKRIGWKKDDFIQDLHTYNQKKDIAIARSKEREQEKIDNQEAIDRVLKEAQERLEKYRYKIKPRQILEIEELIKNKKFIQAGSKLIEYIEGNEAA